MEENITEYVLLFKKGTKLDKEYNGECISEDKDFTDTIFEKFKEQVEQYIRKDWIREVDELGWCTDWEEDWVEVLYSNI